MTRKRFTTPASIPSEEVCRGLVLPNSQDWLGVFSNALSQTIYAYNYEQINETDLTPEEAAAEAYARYVAWLSAGCGGVPPSYCNQQPGGNRIYRVNPVTKKYEYVDGEEWVEDTAIPSTPARTEPTEEERTCAAASNAVEVLRLTWLEAMSQYDANVAAVDAQVDTALAISALVGAVFYPPIIAMAGLTQLGWEIVYNAYEALTAVEWDANLTEQLVCLFKSNADDSGDIVLFDTGAIMRDLWQMAFTGRAYLTIVGQVQWLVSMIGPDGINMAGSLDLVEGDCSGCGTWCYVSSDWSEWERLRGGTVQVDGLRATNGNAAYGAPHGTYATYAEYQLVVDTSQCVITQLEAEISSNALNTSCWTMLAIQPPEDFATKYYVRTNNAAVAFFGRQNNVVQSDSDETTLYVAMTDSNTLTARVKRWRVHGTGVNPFATASNCS